MLAGWLPLHSPSELTWLFITCTSPLGSSKTAGGVLGQHPVEQDILPKFDRRFRTAEQMFGVAGRGHASWNQTV
jgi:hypothetical protein